MSGQGRSNRASIYYIDKDYCIVRTEGHCGSLSLKNKQNQVVATLEGCQDIFTQLTMGDVARELSLMEKKYLLLFVRAKKYRLSKEAAAALDASIVRYEDGREEYLSEKQLKHRISKGIDFAEVFIGRLSARHLRIVADSKNCSYHFGQAKVSKLIIEENCNINIDLRDNVSLETLMIGKNFSGTVNLSRTGIESIFIADSCCCNLNMDDSKKCCNLRIGDVYSGNLNMANSCLYALEIGYYSYADIVLSNNIIKRGIFLGDSFRGVLTMKNQHTEEVKIGDDCKGMIKIVDSIKESGVKKLVVGDNFSGRANLSGDESIEMLEIGHKNIGQIDASYSTSLETINVGKFYGGIIDLTGASVAEVRFGYGASGRIDMQECQNIRMMQATVDNNLSIVSNLSYHDETFGGEVFYTFESFPQDAVFMPFYKKIYYNARNKIHDYLS